MNKKIAIILFFLGLLAVEIWSMSVVYEMAYKDGRRDGIDQMVTRINGMEE